MLQVVTEQEDGSRDTIWSYYPKVDFWESGQILMKKSSNFRILMMADHGESKSGFGAVDDFKFIYESDSVACDTKPSPEPSTTSTTPGSSCPDNTIACSDGIGCYTQVNFKLLKQLKRLIFI